MPSRRPHAGPPGCVHNNFFGFHHHYKRNICFPCLAIERKSISIRREAHETDAKISNRRAAHLSHTTSTTAVIITKTTRNPQWANFLLRQLSSRPLLPSHRPKILRRLHEVIDIGEGEVQGYIKAASPRQRGITVPPQLLPSSSS